MSVPLFAAARGRVGATCGFGFAISVLADLVFAVGMRGQDVCECLLQRPLQQALAAGLQVRA